MTKVKPKQTPNNEAEKQLEAANKAVDLDPKNASNWWGKGIALRDLERYPEALDAFNKAVDLDPEDDLNWRWKAQTLYELQRLDDALVSIEQAIDLNLQSGGLYNMKGVILMGGARYNDALACFDSALQTRINHLYLFNRGTVLLRLKRIDEAEDSISRARDLVSVSKIKTDQEARKHYDDILGKLRAISKPISWWEWWFGKVSKPRQALGAFLILVIVVCLVTPFVGEGRLGWFNCGKDWGTYIVPAAISTLLLILPVIVKFGTQGIEVSPMPQRPETDIRELTKTIEPLLK